MLFIETAIPCATSVRGALRTKAYAASSSRIGGQHKSASKNDRREAATSTPMCEKINTQKETEVDQSKKWRKGMVDGP